MAYISLTDYSLWRMTPATGEQAQLSSPRLRVIRPRWSPDGTQITVQSYPGLPDIYLVPAAGGEMHRLLPPADEGIEREDPDWSPDGHAIIYASLGTAGNSDSGIHVFDLRTHTDTKLANSSGYWRPHWSPDGRLVAALTRDLQRLVIFDPVRKEWREIARGKSLIAEWSHNGKWLYYQDLLARVQPTYRVQRAGDITERVADCSPFLDEGAPRCALAGVAPDDSLMFLIDRGGSNLYAMELYER